MFVTQGRRRRRLMSLSVFSTGMVLIHSRKDWSQTLCAELRFISQGAGGHSREIWKCRSPEADTGLFRSASLHQWGPAYADTLWFFNNLSDSACKKKEKEKFVPIFRTGLQERTVGSAAIKSENSVRCDVLESKWRKERRVLHFYLSTLIFMCMCTFAEKKNKNHFAHYWVGAHYAFAAAKI